MNKSAKLQAFTRQELLAFLQQLDNDLADQHKRLTVTLLGGAAIILLKIRERATIDITPHPDATTFQQMCAKRGIPVDIITISSTVDLHYCPTITVFKGKALTIHTVTPLDLIKLKLERFRKQDPEDIEAILAHESVRYKQFRDIVADMRLDYIGNERELILSAQMVVERLFPEHITDFCTTFQ